MSEEERYDHSHSAHHHPGEEGDHEVIDRPGCFLGGMLGFVVGAIVVVVILMVILFVTGEIGGSTAP